MRWSRGVAIAAIGVACHASDPLGLATAVLTGSVRRGPITPVCQVQVPCDEPFSASFEVRQSDRRIATFRSGVDGSFTVTLAPGAYVVVPASDAPLMNPTAQTKPVEVHAGAPTVVSLLFDTGLR